MSQTIKYTGRGNHTINELEAIIENEFSRYDMLLALYNESEKDLRELKTKSKNEQE